MTIRGKQVKFDPTVNLGHILTAAAMILSVFIAYTQIQVTLRDHETRITAVERNVDRQITVNQSILATLGTIREDIATLKERTLDRP